MFAKSSVFGLIFCLVAPFILFANQALAQTGIAPQPPEGMVLIPGQTFQMGIDQSDLPTLVKMGHKVPHMDSLNALWWFGDEIPRHPVTLDSFYIDRYEVTNAQFAQFVRATGYKAQGNWQKYARKSRENHPVVNVTWNDAQAYARFAGKRLPTEAEWECAARGGRPVKWFPWGNNPDPTRANYRAQGESFFAGLIRIIGLRKMGTKPVGSYPPNGYGLYDVCGNVSEWCANERKPYPGALSQKWFYTKYGPHGSGKNPFYGKAIRGGNWESPNSVFIRITNRRGEKPDYFSRNLGFRCVRSVRK